MAATMVPSESWCMNGYDDSGNLDFSQVDAALLMSLLDDTQAAVEDYDDERLMGVIQSLEAEIGGVEACQPSDAGKIDGGQDVVPEFNGLDLRMMEMVDMEILEPCFPAAQNDGINYWYHCGDDHREMDGVDEYCSRVHFEDVSDYGFLWQETHASSSSLI
nr:TRNA wybutosine-synthesizing protein like [Ipomoea batatas]GME10840.1 TRNA wybutosine-synthesizing protein like [Ipomoea batatas]